MKHHENSKHRMFLLPRSHRKSMYCTKLDAVQIALPDDLNICPYPRNLGTNVRICIAHETGSMAERILQEISNWILGNQTLKFLFPEIIPDARTQRINKSELELKRSGSWQEPTFDTMGVGTKAQGRHYNRIKLDDIYGFDARDSKTEKIKTKQWFDEITPFFVSPKTDGFDLIGTRYDFEDVYAHAMDVYGDNLPRYIRSVIEFNSDTGLYEFIFPEAFDEDSLKEARKNRKLWTAHYLNAPDFRENPDLDPAWIRHFEFSESKNSVVAFTGTERLLRDVEALDKLLFVDPATEGDCGWVITGTDFIANKPNIFVLESERRAIPPDEMISKIFQAVEKWNLRAVVIEEVLFSRLYRHWLQSEMRHRGVYFPIIVAKTGQKAKDARVLGLAPYFAAGQIYFHESQKAIRTEYDQFGTGSDYHILDALAYGPENWRASADREAQERRKGTENKFRKLINPITGYTRVG